MSLRSEIFTFKLFGDDLGDEPRDKIECKKTTIDQVDSLRWKQLDIYVSQIYCSFTRGYNHILNTQWTINLNYNAILDCIQ